MAHISARCGINMGEIPISVQRRQIAPQIEVAAFDAEFLANVVAVKIDGARRPRQGICNLLGAAAPHD